MRNYGYACINKTFSDRPKKQRITTNRTMIKRTFLEKGIGYASELALQNVRDLNTILEWNLKNNIYFYRLSSDMIPWASEYEMEDLPDYGAILAACKRAGNFARKHNMRLTSHPGPFNKLASPKERVFQLTYKDLKVHGDLFDMIGLPRTPYAKLNIHVGAAYGNKPFALDNFCRNFDRLPENVRTRLTVENDDKASLYSTKELYEGVYKRIGIPIVFDYHHHACNPGTLSERDALALAISTWQNAKPCTHYSESAQLERGEAAPFRAHSNYIYSKIDDHGFDIDCVVEAKAKEQAVLKYYQLHGE